MKPPSGVAYLRNAGKSYTVDRVLDRRDQCFALFPDRYESFPVGRAVKWIDGHDYPGRQRNTDERQASETGMRM